MVPQRFGSGRHRVEDPPLLTGRARYTDDFAPDDVGHVAFRRSPYSHARLDAVDTAAAESMDGVLAVLTGRDVEASDAPAVLRADESLPGQRAVDTPVLATDTVRYAGEPIAMVVAEDRYVAHDAVDRMALDLDRLEPVVDARAALEPDAPTVHESVPDNRGLDWHFGDDAGEVDEAFDRAEHVVAVDTTNQRVHPDAMEPRAVLAEPEGGGVTVRMATQAPFLERGLISGALGLDEEQVRVVTPSVGGGFGSKALPYPEQVVVSWAAMRTGRPVKWVATRSESHAADHHGRDIHTRGELALDGSGSILALRAEAVQNIGAHLVFATSPAPNFEHLASGAYRIPLVHGHLQAAYTNTAPIAPYRGAGRPEVIFLVERLVDEAAAELGVDPAELRRRNFVPPGSFPYDTPVSATYDSGQYEAALERAMEVVGYESWRERQSEDPRVGIGVASFVENTGTGPGSPESATVSLTAEGTLRVVVGTADHGQGHATAFASYLAEELGVPFDDIEVEAGDTSFEAGVGGTFGSRSVAVAGSAIAEAAREVRERAGRIAARHLEVSAGDVEFDDGAFHVKGAPERSIAIQQTAALGASEDPPGDLPADLSATRTYDPPNYAHSFGTHIAVVAVDPETGEIDFLDYAAVDDCGVQFNPTVVEGQVHGGVAQGVGQALYEEAVYDENGTVVTGSFMDYALPKAFDVPEMTVDETVTPSPHTPTGAKGVGEGGAIVAPPAVVNAVLDALRPMGVEHLEMPLTGESVWNACRAATRGG